MSDEKLLHLAKEFVYDVSVGTSGYLTAIHFNLINEAHHVITALMTTLVCCAGVHYFKKVLQWFDKSIPEWKNKFITWIKKK